MVSEHQGISFLYLLLATMVWKFLHGISSFLLPFLLFSLLLASLFKSYCLKTPLATFLVISILFLWHLLFLIMVDKMPIPVLIPHNYFSWKSTMVVLRRSKGLYRVITTPEKEPTQNVEKPKLHNHCDEALGLICLSFT